MYTFSEHQQCSRLRAGHQGESDKHELVPAILARDTTGEQVTLHEDKCCSREKSRCSMSAEQMHLVQLGEGGKVALMGQARLESSMMSPSQPSS